MIDVLKIMTANLRFSDLPSGGAYGGPWKLWRSLASEAPKHRAAVCPQTCEIRGREMQGVHSNRSIAELIRNYK